MNATSMGRLPYANGIHFDVMEAWEWESTDGDFYRVELFRNDNGDICFEAYRLNRGRWMPFAGNQETAMNKRDMFSLAGGVEV